MDKKRQTEGHDISYTVLQGFNRSRFLNGASWCYTLLHGVTHNLQGVTLCLMVLNGV